jgi:predicted enzyme related to lactoylglutathione lyase
MAEVVWWEVETPAPELFQRFHEALWGWSFAPAFEGSELGRDYWLIRTGTGGSGGLQRAASEAEPHAGVRLYFEVDDLEATLRRVAELGGRIERGRTFLGGDDRWFANVIDPSGVSFGLWTAQPASS